MKKKKPYLGPLLLAWCDYCNVPLMKETQCAHCGGQTRSVPITPPGDIRPAFQADRAQIISSIANQFDKKVAQQLLPTEKIVLLNAIPDIDCCEEVIMDGQIIGLHRFNVDTLSWTFIPKMEGARRLVQLTPTKQVVIEKSAVEYIIRGANLLRPGIKSADPSINLGEYVIGVTEEGLAVIIGIATMNGPEMLQKGRGMAIKKHYKAEPKEPRILPSGQTWDQVLKANAILLRHLEREAISFMQKMVQKYDLPVVIAFSGGKDSLVVLLLANKAFSKEAFHVMFIDTGIEFPETIENIETTIATMGLEKQLLIKRIDQDQFFRVLELYGFVARDYRVCCKTVKLGPTSQLINQHFPGGCLSFIGQRRYESIRRSSGGRIWKNPWVPKQIGASPIHNWTALMVWLYLFNEKASVNPLYQEGFERIGCMFCPASNMSEIEIIASRYPIQWQRWMTVAKQIAKKQGFSMKWLKHGFWRWKNPPPKVRTLAQKMEIALPFSDPLHSKETIAYTFSLEKDETSKEATIKGQFDASLNLRLAAAFLPALGEVILDLERDMIEVTYNYKPINAFLFKSGLFILSGAVTRKDGDKFVKTILRGILCTACGTCQTVCSNNAISLESGRAQINKTQCNQCGTCLREKCPTLYAF